MTWHTHFLSPAGPQEIGGRTVSPPSGSGSTARPSFPHIFDGGLVPCLRDRLWPFELDRSEKVGLSYALGQAFASIFCEKVLQVPWTMHLDRYADRFNVVFASTKHRPDLLGFNGTGWLVIEAKGRSNGVDSALRQRMAHQKRAVGWINGIRPAMALGCVASFLPAHGTLRVDAVDPEEDDIEPAEVEVSLDLFMLAYYEPFVAALEMGNTEEGEGDFVMSEFEGLGLRVGLHRGILERLTFAIQESPEGLAQTVSSFLSDGRAGRDLQFSDGSAVETEWEEALGATDRDVS